MDLAMEPAIKARTNPCNYVGVLIMKWGVLFRWQSFWIGAHWSPYNKRLCINLVPFVTIWIVLNDGQVPQQSIDDKAR